MVPAIKENPNLTQEQIEQLVRDNIIDPESIPDDCYFDWDQGGIIDPSENINRPHTESDTLDDIANELAHH